MMRFSSCVVCWGRRSCVSVGEEAQDVARTMRPSSFIRMLDAVSDAEIIVGNLPVLDAAHLALTCRRLRGIHIWKVVKDGTTLDFSRLSKPQRVSGFGCRRP